MSLQLPSRAAPPSNYQYPDPTPSSKQHHATAAVPTASSSSSATSPLRTSRRPRRAAPSPFIASKGTSSGANNINSHARDHRAFGNAGQGIASSVFEQNIAEMEDVDQLEDMMRHTDAMLRNP